MHTPQAPGRKKKRAIIIGIIILALAGAAVGGWFIFKPRPQGASSDTQQAASQKDSQEVNTGSSKANSEPQKLEGGVDRPQVPAPLSGASKATVIPIIAGFNRSGDGQFLVVDGGVNQVIENGGTCRFVVRWSGGEMVRQTQGFASPSSTSCATAQFTMGELPAGTNLTIQLHYQSHRYEGTSTNGPSLMKEQIQ